MLSFAVLCYTLTQLAEAVPRVSTLSNRVGSFRILPWTTFRKQSCLARLRLSTQTTVRFADVPCDSGSWFGVPSSVYTVEWEAWWRMQLATTEHPMMDCRTATNMRIPSKNPQGWRYWTQDSKYEDTAIVRERFSSACLFSSGTPK